MSTNATQTQNGTGNQKLPADEIGCDLAAKIGFVIGVDGEGDVHVHYETVGVVQVFDVDEDYQVGDYLDTDDVVLEQDLERRPLRHWMQYVRDERGTWALTTHRAPEGF